jgi:hypothetical protein
MRTCLAGVDLNAVGGGPRAHPTTQLVWAPTGRETTAPAWMNWLWQTFSTAYPAPVLSVGPTARPRVNVPTVFWLAGEAAAPLQRQVFDGVERIAMTARLRRLVVHPGVKAGEAGIDCGAGTAAYDPATDPYRQTSRCRYTYDRSSASLPGQAYPARADASWEVGWTDAAGRWHTLGSYTVSSVQLIPVQEVQAVVD